MTGTEVVSKMKADKCLTQSRSRNGKKYHNKYTEYFGKLGYSGINKSGIFTMTYSYGVVGHCCIAVQYWLCKCGYSDFIPKSPKYLFNTNNYMAYMKKQPNGVKWTTDRTKAKIGAIAFKGGAKSSKATHTCVFIKYSGDYVYSVDFNVSDGKGHNNGALKKRHKKYFRGFANIPYKADSLSLNVGSTYKLLEDMNLRKSASKTAELVPEIEWTASALKSRTAEGLLAKGTKVTCKELKKIGGATWMRIPSGWICAIGSTGKEFVRESR